ncbi:unnamed protein product [Alopecurus aequalis]
MDIAAMGAAAKKPKPESLSNSAAGAGAGKTVEEMQRQKTQLEHIFLRPDTYLGYTYHHTSRFWVYEDGGMVQRDVTYVPALYKIFDDILVSAADNKRRDPSMDSLRVHIHVEEGRISVYSNGCGLPIEIHQEEEGVYVPEAIFASLLTISGHDYGVILANMFSTEFVVETADGEKKYKQVFSENMGRKSVPEIKKCKRSENWTRVTFRPDLAKFNMTHLDYDIVALMRKRVIDMAAILGETVMVELNGEKVATRSFLEYVKLYTNSGSKDGVERPSFYQKVNDRWEVCVILSKGQFQQVSFVNGRATTRGGTHVDYVVNQIANHVRDIVNREDVDKNAKMKLHIVRDILNRKDLDNKMKLHTLRDIVNSKDVDENAKMKLHTVRGYLCVFVNALIENPAFNSQTKEALTTHEGSFGSTCCLSDDLLNKVAKWVVVRSVLNVPSTALSIIMDDEVQVEIEEEAQPRKKGRRPSTRYPPEDWVGHS